MLDKENRYIRWDWNTQIVLFGEYSIKAYGLQTKLQLKLQRRALQLKLETTLQLELQTKLQSGLQLDFFFHFFFLSSSKFLRFLFSLPIKRLG